MLQKFASFQPTTSSLGVWPQTLIGISIAENSSTKMTQQDDAQLSLSSSAPHKDEESEEIDLDALCAAVLKSASTRELMSAPLKWSGAQRAVDGAAEAAAKFASLVKRFPASASGVAAKRRRIAPPVVAVLGGSPSTRTTSHATTPTTTTTTTTTAAAAPSLLASSRYRSALLSFRSYRLCASFAFGSGGAPPSSLSFANRVAPLLPLCRYDLHGVCK
jgi:hypothetical protein